MRSSGRGHDMTTSKIRRKILKKIEDFYQLDLHSHSSLHLTIGQTVFAAKFFFPASGDYRSQISLTVSHLLLVLFLIHFFASFFCLGFSLLLPISFDDSHRSQLLIHLQRMYTIGTPKLNIKSISINQVMKSSKTEQTQRIYPHKIKSWGIRLQVMNWSFIILKHQDISLLTNTPHDTIRDHASNRSITTPA